MVGNYAGEDHLHSDLTHYPYYNQWSGNYESPDSLSAERKRFRLDIEDKLLYDLADLGGNHLKAKIRPFQFFIYKRITFSLSRLFVLRKAFPILHCSTSPFVTTG
jgi:hypothetical protein